jgi:hypothetical protein
VLCRRPSIIILLLLLAGCAGPQTFFTRSSIVPIEFSTPIEPTWDPKSPPRERELRLTDKTLDAIRAESVRLFDEEQHRDLTTDAVVLTNEHALVIEPGERERRFTFLLGKPRLKWVGDDLCATIRVGEVTACPREDVAYPLYFKRALLAVLGELGQQTVDRPPPSAAKAE